MAKGLFGRLQQELEAREKVAGLTMADILQLPAAESELVNWLVRSGEVSWSGVVARVGEVARAQSLLTTLIAKGFVREQEGVGEATYSVRLAPRRKRELPANIWDVLTGKLEKKAEE